VVVDFTVAAVASTVAADFTPADFMVGFTAAGSAIGLGGLYAPYAGDYYYPYADTYGYPDYGYDQPYSAQYWYYCSDPAGYYPYVSQCNTGWQPVPAG
jgi:hypothetical protein